MLEAIKTLIRSKDVCVLSTVSGGEPHCSLMSYVTDESCETFFMLTRKETKKYHNLEGNRAVSLLMDTREEDINQSRKNMRVLTVSGVYEKLEDPSQQEKILRQLLERHPHLKDVIGGAEAALFSVRAKSFQFLDGVSRSYFEEIDR